ncbi:MAG TPA: hypothetical protein VMJ35_12110 [Dongiaceae bacterium]|nr:hypothetical protein [Dongiaceae bacterium]
MKARPLAILTTILYVLLAACSSGPTAPPGTQRFLDAKNNLKASDFKAALTNLDTTIKTATDPAMKEEAYVIRVAVLTAMAEADRQMGEAYQIGSKQPAANGHMGAYLKNRSDYYNTAHSLLMNAMQGVMDQRSKLGDKPLTIELTFPGFTGSNPTLEHLKEGQLLSEGDQVQAELQADRNALAKVLTAIAGAKDDVNKGQEIYGKGKVEIDPRVYLIALSDSFLTTGAMFGSHGLNEVDHLATVSQVVKGNIEAAEKLLSAKPDKDLEAQAKLQLDRSQGKTEKRGK